MNDTSPEMEARYRAMLMAKTPSERFRMGLSMCETARKIVLSSLPPGLSDHERRVAILRRYNSSDFTEEQLVEISRHLR